jgi:rfaE bifunctional protein kinase chain/domain
MKKVLVSGNFNVLHPGHLRLLRFAKTCGDKLIVAVQSDRLAGAAAVVPENFRLEGIQNNKLVDETFIYDEPVEELIARLQPEIIVKGREHENLINHELNAINEYGGRLIFSSGDVTFSSSDLMKSEIKGLRYNDLAIKEYLNRHNIDLDRVSKMIRRFSNLKVCVIGDLIIDEYIACEALGMSQEDPTLVVSPISSKKFLGGAGIVAAHASSLGAEVKFISVSGNDDGLTFAQKEFAKYRIKSEILIDDDRPTTLKQRFRAQNKTLLRVSHLSQSSISVKLQNKIKEAIFKQIGCIDLLVFSDFNYGCLPQGLVDDIILECNRLGIKVVADSQASSQISDISRFKNIELITPTEREARLSLRDNSNGLAVLANELIVKANSKHILLKLGSEGVFVHTKMDKDSNWVNDRLPSFNSNPTDVAGAGDCMLTCASMALALGADIWTAAFIGSAAAAEQISKLGNLPITQAEVCDALSMKIR